MRNQRRAPLTVTLVHVASTDNGLGDITQVRTVTTVDRATFEPERTLERVGSDQAAVLEPASFNVPGVHELDADDLVLPGEIAAEDLDEYEGVRWQVVGGSTIWLDRTKVPVQEARGV